MNLNNESGSIAKSGAKVRLIYGNSNTGASNGENDNQILNQWFFSLTAIRYF
jgi:hypothetical protein